MSTPGPQVLSIASFLAPHNVRCEAVGKGDKRGSWRAAYRLDIVEFASVLKAAKAMLDQSVKKKTELGVAIDHREGRIIGKQAPQVLNEVIEVGKRRGKIRKAGLCLSPGRRAFGCRSWETSVGRD